MPEPIENLPPFFQVPHGQEPFRYRFEGSPPAVAEEEPLRQADRTNDAAILLLFPWLRDFMIYGADPTEFGNLTDYGGA